MRIMKSEEDFDQVSRVMMDYIRKKNPDFQ